MAGLLSNVFGDDNESSSDNSSNLISDIGATASVDASNEDGSSESSSSAQNFGTDIDTDSLLGGSNDSSSSSDSDSDGGLLG